MAWSQLRYCLLLLVLWTPLAKAGDGPIPVQVVQTAEGWNPLVLTAMSSEDYGVTIGSQRFNDEQPMFYAVRTLKALVPTAKPGGRGGRKPGGTARRCPTGRMPLRNC